MLKALVNVEAYVDGKRVRFAPGDEVKGLHPHDVKQLIASKSIEDTEATKRAEKLAAAEEKAAGQDFEDAKAKVQAHQESIAQPVETKSADKARGKK